MMKQSDLSKTVLGIELGSTRIKAVLLDEDYLPIASGSFTWENQFVDGVWTYALSDAETGLQTCFAALKADFEQKYAQKLTTVGTIGVSAMMHGYLPFDKDGNQLAAFRTWRNTMTGEAVEKLTELFGFNIPQRASVSGAAERRSTYHADRLSDDACRIRPLAADRQARAWHRRLLWYVPDRQQGARLRCRNAPEVPYT